MSDTLQVNAIDYGGIDAAGEDPIYKDDQRLAAAAALFEAHEPALKDVLNVGMTLKAYYITTKATPDELMPVRHEIKAMEDVYERLKGYHGEWTAREASKKSKKDAENKPKA